MTLFTTTSHPQHHRTYLTQGWDFWTREKVWPFKLYFWQAPMCSHHSRTQGTLFTVNSGWCMLHISGIYSNQATDTLMTFYRTWSCTSNMSIDWGPPIYQIITAGALLVFCQNAILGGLTKMITIEHREVAGAVNQCSKNWIQKI